MGLRLLAGSDYTFAIRSSVGRPRLASTIQQVGLFPQLHWALGPRHHAVGFGASLYALDCVTAELGTGLPM